MSNNLFEAIKFDERSYYELPDNSPHKDTIERIVFKIKENETLEKTILSFNQGERISIITGEAATGYSVLYDTTFPKDLSEKIIKIYVHLND